MRLDIRILGRQNESRFSGRDAAIGMTRDKTATLAMLGLACRLRTDARMNTVGST